MEGAEVFGQRIVLLPVHVKVKAGDAALALIGQRNLAGFAEGHRPVRVAGSAEGCVADDQRVHVSLVAMSYSKEVSERDIHAGRFMPVVIDAQAQKARPSVLIVGDSDPDMRHDSRTFQVSQDDGLARDGVFGVIVTVHIEVIAGRAVSREGLEAWEVQGVKRVRSRTLPQRPAGKDQKHDHEDVTHGRPPWAT